MQKEILIFMFQFMFIRDPKKSFLDGWLPNYQLYSFTLAEADELELSHSN